MPGDAVLAPAGRADAAALAPKARPTRLARKDPSQQEPRRWERRRSGRIWRWWARWREGTRWGGGIWRPESGLGGRRRRWVRSTESFFQSRGRPI
uniref:Uncharacterized protein n=1 Tax=Arundo donax TaxID=35708 RepID=A0A0A9SQP4_ARUDO